MDKRVAWPALATLLVINSGCALFNISDGSNVIKGIPFYSKVGKLKQTTVWSRTWLEVSFTLSDVDKDGKKSNTRSGFIQIVEKTPSSDDLNQGALAAQVAAKSKDLPEIIKAFEDAAKVTKIPPSKIVGESAADFTGQLNFLLQSLVSNGTDLVAEVDYRNKYFYNAQVPIFSSAEASIKLADDGSLSEVSSKADTTKLADVIPVGGLLSKELGLTSSSGTTTPAAINNAAPSTGHELNIVIDRKGFTYTLARLLSPDSPRTQKPIAFGEEESIIRSALGGDAGKKDDKGKKATFEGSVNLPEGK